MDINKAIFLIDNSNLPNEYYRPIRELLLELKQRRKEEEYMNIKVIK